MTECRLQDIQAEADRDRAIGIALAARRRERGNIIGEARTAVAMLLFRAGSWLMPEGQQDAQQTVPTLGLRLGR